MMREDEWILKICILGSKIDLNLKFGNWTADQKADDYPVLGYDIRVKRLKLNDQKIRLVMMIIHSSGGMGRTIMEGSSGCVILFDKGDRVSFNKVNDWHREYVNIVSDSPIAIVGIKTKIYNEEIATEAPFHRLMESEEEVSTEEGQQLARELNTSYYETTLKDKDQVSTILKALAKKYLESLR